MVFNGKPVVNDTTAAPFAATLGCPADFPDAARAANDIARLRVCAWEFLQCGLAFVVDMQRQLLGELRCLNEQHILILRKLRFLKKHCPNLQVAHLLSWVEGEGRSRTGIASWYLVAETAAHFAVFWRAGKGTRHAVSACNNERANAAY